MYDFILITSLLMPPAGWVDKAIANTIVVVEQDEITYPTKRTMRDVTITIISLTAGGIAVGLTASCISNRTCEEKIILMKKLVGHSMERAILVNMAIKAGIHWIVWKFAPEGKVRTLSLAILAGGNIFDATWDYYQVRKINRR